MRNDGLHPSAQAFRQRLRFEERTRGQFPHLGLQIQRIDGFGLFCCVRSAPVEMFEPRYLASREGGLLSHEGQQFWLALFEIGNAAVTDLGEPGDMFGLLFDPMAADVAADRVNLARAG